MGKKFLCGEEKLTAGTSFSVAIQRGNLKENLPLE